MTSSKPPADPRAGEFLRAQQAPEEFWAFHPRPLPPKPPLAIARLPQLMGTRGALSPRIAGCRAKSASCNDPHACVHAVGLPRVVGPRGAERQLLGVRGRWPLARSVQALFGRPMPTGKRFLPVVADRFAVAVCPRFRGPRGGQFGSTKPKMGRHQPSNAHELRNSGSRAGPLQVGSCHATRNRTGSPARCPGHRPKVLTTSPDISHPDVQHTITGSNVGEPGPIRRDPRQDPLRVPKKDLARDQRNRIQRHAAQPTLPPSTIAEHRRRRTSPRRSNRFTQQRPWRPGRRL